MTLCLHNKQKSFRHSRIESYGISQKSESDGLYITYYGLYYEPLIHYTSKSFSWIRLESTIRNHYVIVAVTQME